MARFRYRMQSILDVKEKLETQARQEFGNAKAALDEEVEKLHGLKARKSGYEERAKELLQGTLNVRDIEENKAAILKMDDYIHEQQAQVQRAERKLELARAKLQEVMQDRKMHEKLRERAFEQFLEDEKHAEGKEVDELTSYVYGQRILEENAGRSANMG